MESKFSLTYFHTDEKSNYRPISKICHIDKLFESLVLQSIQKSVNHVLIDEQHGFRSGRSTTTCNAIFTSYALDAFSNRSQVDVIYTDFAKAFDRVNHKALLQVLRVTGLDEPLLSWFESYVTGRKQFVKFNGVCSSMVNITSGVPQGGYLSPVLFALFINGISSVLKNCRFLVFADDIKLFLCIESSRDCDLLQSELNALVFWSRQLGLELCVPKCHYMPFTSSHSPIRYDYLIDGTSLSFSGSHVVDLGVTFDRTLSFNLHIGKITCKALKMLGFIKRISSEFNMCSSLKALYCAFVRSYLVYGVVIWAP